jgi:hypothetical protein
MIKLIRQLDSIGSQRKEYGVHASVRRKPEVSFKAPTYRFRGSNFSSTPQGGINKAGCEGISVKSRGLRAFNIDSDEYLYLKIT